MSGEANAADALATLRARLAEIEAELSACTESPGGCGYWRERAARAEARAERAEAAVAAEREQVKVWAIQIARRWDGRPCKAAPAWSEEERAAYEHGQLDASASIAAALRAADPTPEEGDPLAGLKGAARIHSEFWRGSDQTPEEGDEGEAET